MLLVDPAILAAELIPAADPAMLEGRANLDRVDRKLVLSRAALSPLLDTIGQLYCAVPANGRHTATYQTTYFDTADLRCFHDHRRGKGRRFKVRVRDHVERALTFLEVKERTPAGRTRKHRLERPFRSVLDLSGSDEHAFVADSSPFDPSELVPTVRVDCRRLTLVRPGSFERVTIDWDLSFVDPTRGARVDAEGLVIAELKSDGAASSPAIGMLRAAGAYELSISKYCVGACLVSRAPGTQFANVLRAARRLASPGKKVGW